MNLEFFLWFKLSNGIEIIFSFLSIKKYSFKLKRLRFLCGLAVF